MTQAKLSIIALRKSASLTLTSSRTPHTPKKMNDEAEIAATARKFEYYFNSILSLGKSFIMRPNMITETLIFPRLNL